MIVSHAFYFLDLERVCGRLESGFYAAPVNGHEQSLRALLTDVGYFLLGALALVALALVALALVAVPLAVLPAALTDCSALAALAVLLPCAAELLAVAAGLLAVLLAALLVAVRATAGSIPRAAARCSS